MWLGKYVRADLTYFHIGDTSEPPNAQRTELTRALWKFLADHVGHPIRVIRDDDADFDTVAGYRQIDGDEARDVSFTDYLRDWPG
jgi:hypothetical protein